MSNEEDIVNDTLSVLFLKIRDSRRKLRSRATAIIVSLILSFSFRCTIIEFEVRKDTRI